MSKFNLKEDGKYIRWRQGVQPEMDQNGDGAIDAQTSGSLLCKVTDGNHAWRALSGTRKTFCLKKKITMKC